MIDHLTLPEAVKYALTGMVVVMSILALLCVLITLISKAIAAGEGRRAAPADDLPQPQPVSPAAPLPAAAPQAPFVPQVELVETDEETAALLMAIVADQSGVALDHLLFRRIKLLGEQKEQKEQKTQQSYGGVSQ
jgi:Na+-transporting methylmalonyl-CoA/oxaloacetate decarboxylase gamma subunit